MNSNTTNDNSTPFVMRSCDRYQVCAFVGVDDNSASHHGLFIENHPSVFIEREPGQFWNAYSNLKGTYDSEKEGSITEVLSGRDPQQMKVEQHWSPPFAHTDPKWSRFKPVASTRDHAIFSSTIMTFPPPKQELDPLMSGIVKRKWMEDALRKLSEMGIISMEADKGFSWELIGNK